MTARVVDDPVRGRCVEEDAVGGGVIRTYFGDRDAEIRHGGTAVLIDRHVSRREPKLTGTTSPSPVRVYLTHSAFAQLDGQIYARSDGNEHGWWLLGQADLDCPRVSGVVDDGSYQRSATDLIVDLWESDRYETLVGHAHTHPRSCVASPPDVRLWERARERAHLPLFVGLICNADAADPTVPVRFNAYAVTAHAGCQPARLTIGGKH
jgi:hypothetical protein